MALLLACLYAVAAPMLILGAVAYILFGIWWVMRSDRVFHPIDARRFFQDRVVWVTGASSGLGEAFAHELYKCGAQLVLSSRREEALQAVARACVEHREEGHTYHEPMVLPLDLSDADSLPDRVREVLARFGRIDILINNSGISSRGAALATKLDVDRRVMETNYFGTVALTKAVLPSMIRQRRGHIAVVSSVQGKIGIPFRAAYTSSKFALHGFFEALQHEVYDHGVRVCVCCPGYVRTNISLNALKGDGSPYDKMDEVTARGYSPVFVAHRLLTGIMEESREVWVAVVPHKLAMFLRDILPSALWWGIHRRAARELAEWLPQQELLCRE